jgi:hypothetical protein
MRIGWYENDRGNFDRLQIIQAEGKPGGYYSPRVAAIDLDGDKDLDVLASYSSLADSRSIIVSWYENTDGNGQFGPQRSITTQGILGPSSLNAVDVDGDGDWDLVVAGNGSAWYENTDGKGNFGSRHPIAPLGDESTARDMDGDGDFDVVLAATDSLDRSQLVWYQNTDGKGTFRIGQTIASQSHQRFFQSQIVDLDGDKDLDVIVIDEDRDAVWYQNGGQGDFTLPKKITDRVLDLMTVDVDRDGDWDLVSIGDGGSIQWQANADGKGDFLARRSIVGLDAAWSLDFLAADMDLDGDLDILTTRLPFVSNPTEQQPPVNIWVENTDGRGTFANRRVIGNHMEMLYAGDVDGDGDPDVITAQVQDVMGLVVVEESIIAWHRNVDGKGSFQPGQVFAKGSIGTVLVADLDNDRDPEVLFAFSQYWFMGARIGAFGWYDLSAGKVDLASPRLINNDGAFSIRTADFDSDGDLDLLAIESYCLLDIIPNPCSSKIVVYTNLDGETFRAKVIQGESNKRIGLAAADIDGDNDLDIVASLYEPVEPPEMPGDPTVVWFENMDAKGTFSAQKVLEGFPNEMTVTNSVDLDNDGDQDLILRTADAILWMEKSEAGGMFSPPKILIEQVTRFHPNNFSDLDQDGDLDLIAGTSWYENTDGKGSFGLPHSTPADADLVFASDMDRDGDPDLVIANGMKIAWYKNLGVPGDANRDGRFDSSDLVQVLQAGEYEDGIAGNSMQDEGDFNGDGDFTTADLVFAFAAGSYVLNGL